MKVQLLTAAILLLGVAASNAESDNPGYLTGPRNVLKTDITLKSSAGLQQPVTSGKNNEQTRGVCDPTKTYRVGDHCVALGPD
jgi:hypothetical protein